MASDQGSSQRRPGRGSLQRNHQLRRARWATLWCHLCAYVTDTQQEHRHVINLRAHYRRTHEKVRIFRCRHPGCDARPFPRKDRFREHVKRRHQGKGRSKAATPEPERQITKFARGCGRCASVFSDDLDVFLEHHVQHCQNGARKSEWCLLKQIEGLLCQSGLVETWHLMLDYLLGQPNDFLQWCMHEEPGLLDRLEGNPAKDSSEEHAVRVRATVWTLFDAVSYTHLTLPTKRIV